MPRKVYNSASDK